MTDNVADQLEEAVRILNLIVKRNDAYRGTPHGFIGDCPMMTLARSFVDDYLAANPTTKANKRRRAVWAK